MPTLIYNNNNYVRWDKDECDTYTITSIIEYSDVTVTVEDMTPSDPLEPWTQSFTLAPNGTAQVILPGDGVFKICAVAVEALPNNLCTMTTNNFVQSTINIGQLNDGTDSQLWMVQMLNGGVIYQSLNYGGTDPVAHFGTPPASYQPAITTIQTWLAGTGLVEIVPPGVAPTITPWDTTIDAQDYRLIILHPTDSVDIVVTAQTELIRPVFHYPDVDCVTYWTGNGCARDWITSIVFNGEEILDRPYDQTNPDDVILVENKVREWLSANGGGRVVNDPQAGLLVVFDTCLQSATVTLGDMVPSVEECDYIYEFCDMYACLTKLMRNWLCLDPCATQSKCSNETLSYEEARRRAVEMSTMFFHALMPLVSHDRLWHLGNWDVSNDRTCHINNILELYKKLREYANSCGWNCDCKCKPCGDCDPCSGTNTSYSYSSPTPCTGCK